MLNIVLKLEEDSDEVRYLRAAARIRRISPTSLLRRLVSTIAQDQLVLSILDDEGEIHQKRPGEYRYSERTS